MKLFPLFAFLVLIVLGSYANTLNNLPEISGCWEFPQSTMTAIACGG